MARKKKKPTSRKKKAKKKEGSGSKSRKRPSKAVEAPPPDPPAEPEPEAAPAVLDEDDVPVIDLDADEEDDPIERLIAEAVAGAMPDEALEPPQPVVDLDAVEDEDVAFDEGDDAARAAAEGPTTAEPAEGGDDAVSTPAPTDESAEAGAEPLPRQEIADEVARRLVDLGPVSTPELRDRLLAEALAHAEHKDARYRIPFSASAAVGRWKALAAIVILLIAGTVALVPPGWARPEPPAQLAAAERATNLRAALLLQAQQIEAFRVRTQRLPISLDEVAGTLPGLRYVRSGSRAYQLIVYEPSGEAIVYDSTSPSAPFADVTIGWGGEP